MHRMRCVVESLCEGFCLVFQVGSLLMLADQMKGPCHRGIQDGVARATRQASMSRMLAGAALRDDVLERERLIPAA